MQIPPNSARAEEAVISIALANPQVLPDISLDVDGFFSRPHKLIWESIQELFRHGELVDHITVATHLDNRGMLEQSGGIDKFLEINDADHTPQNVEGYVDIIKDCETRRGEIEILAMACERAYAGEQVSDDVVSKLMDMSVRHVNMSDDVIYDHWERAKDGQIVTVPTPSDKLNQIIGGVKQGLHTILCGRGGSGKSMFMASWYVHLGMHGIPTLVMPFEDKYEITKTRMAANLGRYKWHKIQYGGERVNINGSTEWVKVTRKELDQARDCMERIGEMPIYFEPQRIGLKGLRSKIIRAKAQHGIRIVFIDGAKDIRRPTGMYNDTGYDEEISQEICSIAEDEQVAIVSVFHLTKIPPGELITEGNIRGSGQIVNDARCVMALQSKGLQENGCAVEFDDRGNQTTRAIDVVKSNHSRLGSVRLETDLEKVQFYEA